MADYLLKEDGFHIELEDGTGDLLLEDAIIVPIIPVGPFGGRSGGGSFTAKRGSGGLKPRYGKGGFVNRKGKGGF